MTDSIADRTYQAALVAWQSNPGIRKPERADFSHLDTAPAEVPDFVPAPAVSLGSVATPEPLDAADRQLVDQALEHMHRGLRLPGQGHRA